MCRFYVQYTERKNDTFLQLCLANHTSAWRNKTTAFLNNFTKYITIGLTELKTFHRDKICIIIHMLIKMTRHTTIV